MADSDIETISTADDGGNREFPVPLSSFAATLKGLPDEIWLGVLKRFHGLENHTPTEWRALIDSHRDDKA